MKFYLITIVGLVVMLMVSVPVMSQFEPYVDRELDAMTEDLDSLSKGVCPESYDTSVVCQITSSQQGDTVVKKIVMTRYTNDRELLGHEFRIATYFFTSTRELYRLTWYDSAVPVDPLYKPQVSLTEFTFAFLRNLPTNRKGAKVDYWRISHDIENGKSVGPPSGDVDHFTYPYIRYSNKARKLKYRLPGRP